MSKLTSQSISIVTIMVYNLDMSKYGKLHYIYSILFHSVLFLFCIVIYIIHLADDLSNATFITFKVYI